MKRPLEFSKPSFSTPRDESKLSSIRLSEKTFNKKRFWLIVALLAVAEMIVIGLVWQWKYIFPSNEVSDLYKKYAEMDGVDATFIKGYKVNDSVFVDVTMLCAKTDSAWESLLHDFNISSPPQEVIDNKGEDCIDLWAAPKKDYSLPMDTMLLNNDLISMSWSEHIISVFSIQTMQQLHFLRHHLYKESISKSQTSKNKQNEQNI